MNKGKRSSTSDQKQNKRLCVFRDIWMKDEEWLKPSVNNVHKAFCKYCNKEFSIAHGGKSDVTQHCQGAEHKKNKITVASSSSLKSFFTVKNSAESDKLAFAELTLVFHTVKHNLSYNSMDCGHKLFPKLFEDSKIATKVSCGRTKAESILKNVLCPMFCEQVVNDLKDNYFSISTDASNKGNRKFHPVCVQYFTKEKGICKKLLNFVESPFDTSDNIVHSLKSTLDLHNLNLSKVSAFSADNTNANMGKTRSAFTLLKGDNPHLLKAGCLCHVINNAFRHAMDMLEVDVESAVMKMYSYFSSSSARRESLKEFYEFVDLNYTDLLRHVTTRWLSFAPAVDRIIRNWPALMSYFISEQDNLPKHLVKLLYLNEESTVESCETNDLSLVLHFISNIATVFEVASKKLQNENTVASELYEVMTKLVAQLDNRINDQFFGAFTTKVLKRLPEHKQICIKNQLNLFLQTAANYCRKWFDFSDKNPLYIIKPINLDKELCFQDLTTIVEELNIDGVNEDNLYEEFSIVKDIIKPLSEDKEMDVGSKWQMIFRMSKVDLDNLFKIAAFCLSIPPSNAFVERVFSHMNLKWTDVRNRCSLLQI